MSFEHSGTNVIPGKKFSRKFFFILRKVRVFFREIPGTAAGNVNCCSNAQAWC